MKPFLLACLLYSLPALAQKFKVDESTVVKDSSGFVFPYNVWQPIIEKGSHKLVPEKPGDAKTAFYLVRVSDEEKFAGIARMPKPRESSYFRTGRRETLYTVTDIDGNKLNRADTKGKIIVMNFWFINCRPCRMEIPDLNEVVARYANNDKVIFVAIGLDQKHEIESFLQQLPFNYRLVDNGRNITLKYGVQSFPTHVIFDGEGKVYFHTSGLAPNTVYWVKKSIDELLALDGKKLASN